jgi:hypothetical protein
LYDIVSNNMVISAKRAVICIQLSFTLREAILCVAIEQREIMRPQIDSESLKHLWANGMQLLNTAVLYRTMSRVL